MIVDVLGSIIECYSLNEVFKFIRLFTITVGLTNPVYYLI